MHDNNFTQTANMLKMNYNQTDIITKELNMTIIYAMRFLLIILSWSMATFEAYNDLDSLLTTSFPMMK
ncbi:hypothetical protein BV912_10310 [Neisseria dumasiana]|uniref:Uncharacterized protein n=1 Tax=Neisseria dumasiana TaxID=1931275 RepID=A0A1X3DF97_9NEIS|nr:hypothetical protein BV912_10310 [Neisseria dumasiana]OSI33843.1 hypothetical protein BV913_08255 [Neisseria dumasiana]